MSDRVVFATFSTWVTPTVMINRGEPWDADDPVVKSHPDWFADEPVDVRTSEAAPSIGSEHPWAEPKGKVEAATANPGEKRHVTRPKASGDDE